MTRADSVHSTPPLNTSALPKELIQQERRRQQAIKRLAKLRRKAFDEIERLLAFIDQSDPYVMTEQEINGDEDDASYPESGIRAVQPMEDDEDGADDEPSLGSSGHYEAGPIIYLAHAISDGCEMVHDCEGDEHDGREPDCEDEGAQCDDEGVTA